MSYFELNVEEAEDISPLLKNKAKTRDNVNYNQHHRTVVMEEALAAALKMKKKS